MNPFYRQRRRQHTIGLGSEECKENENGECEGKCQTGGGQEYACQHYFNNHFKQWHCQCQPRQEDTPNAQERYDLQQLFDTAEKWFAWDRAQQRFSSVTMTVHPNLNFNAPHLVREEERIQQLWEDYEVAQRNHNVRRIAESNIIARFGKNGLNLMNTQNF